MSLASGERLGHYEVISLIGTGGMGEVYRARDPRLGRDVAVKTLRSAGADARARLWREARAAASVSHPSVCQIHDVGETSDNIYIVMELLQGEPLAHRLKDGPIAVDEAITAALGILGALTALHSRDIVHRDLKPSNVFLTDTGVKLLDFGLARSRQALSEAELAITQAGTIVGTPRYMAPEQWADGPPDPRSDVFTTGSLLFEMLTGSPAFGGTDLVQVYHNIMSSHPPPLAGSAVTAAVDVVIHRALEKRPEDRYPSAEAMAQALRSAVTLVSSGTQQTQAPVRATTRLIALPFRMLRPDPDLDFLSFSLPDAVVSSLAGLESLVVRSTLAGAKYAGADTIDLNAIANELGVDAVLTGTLLRAGDQVRVSAQLIEAASGTMRWSKTVQMTMRDLFEVQDQLARAIVESLSIPLSSGEKRRLAHDLPASARAYEFYLRANQVGHDPTMLSVAGELYRSALAEDPHYAPAWAKLGRVYRVLAKYGADDATENLKRADEAFQRALQLKPDLSIAHNLYTNFEVESLGRAKEAMARLLARASSHSDPEIFTGLVIACRFCGLLDASLAADRQARRLDPAVRTSVMYTHFMLGDWDRAMASDTDTLKWVTNWTLPLLGRQDEAIAAYRELESRPLPGTIRDLMRACRLVLEGKKEESYTIAQTFFYKHFDPEGLYFTARVLARLGEPEASLDLLDRIIEQGFSCSAIMLRDPWMDSIRGRSRFSDVVRRADARTREADAEFRRLDGERILGSTS
jgi:serine/threonine protein kinase/tetratricopeptide (TPR) repeat protein